MARSAAGAGTSAGWEVVFHKGQSEMNRPHATAITAGAAHSCCLTRTGAVLAWCSWDPQLNVQEVQGCLAGVPVVALAAGELQLLMHCGAGLLEAYLQVPTQVGWTSGTFIMGMRTEACRVVMF